MISRKKKPPLEGLPLDKVLSYVLLHLLLSPPAVPDGGEVGGQIWNIYLIIFVCSFGIFEIFI